MNVAANLFEYLRNHDKAELPGLGTFFVQMQSAQISPLTGAIEPPCRQLSFRSEETGDLSFVKDMAEKEFISEQTSLVWIKQYTDSVKEKLEAGQKCKIGQLGEFVKDFAGNYTFNAATVNLLDDAFAFKTLKGVKTFDVQEPISPIVTREPLNEEIETPIEQTQTAYQSDETPIYSAPIEESKPAEQERELPKETVDHSEAVVAAELEEMESESEVSDTLSVEETPQEEAVLSPIEKEVEINEIKPQDEELRAKAQAIIEESRRQKEEEKEAERKAKEEKKRAKKAKKRRKRVLVVILCILLFLLLCCGGFVAAFYFNLLPNKPFLKPITEKLSYYIKPKAQPVVLAQPEVETPTLVVEETFTETVTEEFAEEELIESTQEQTKQTTPAQTPRPKVKKQQQAPKTETAEAPKPTEPDNTSPVVVQNYSRLGFDVIGGSFSSRANAERLARKAKSLGYDSYVLSKVKSGSPIYYVSYGSRRSLKEANDLMAKMTATLGGDYYVISR